MGTEERRKGDRATMTEMSAISRGDTVILEGPPGTRLLGSPDDIVDVIGACFEHHTRTILLYAENLTPNFFDLSSGEAGAILQKLRNYHITAAIVAPTAEVRQSIMFRQVALEETKAGDFRIFEDRDSAQLWLASK
jgi:hypothetical protein